MPSLATRLAVENLRVTAVRRSDAIDGSYTTGGSPLSAADVGATATITVAAHTRVYGTGRDFPPVSLTGGTVTGLAFATEYHVYYDDDTLANPAPTFAATTTASHAQANYARGRHPLGKVTTPADGAGGTTGGGSTPPGGSITSPLP